MSVKVLLLLAVSMLPLTQTPSDAGANNAPRVQNPAPAAPAEPSKWERYTFPGEEFSVELPEMPFVFNTTRRVSRTLSDNERMRVFGVYSGGAVFIIVSYDNPRNGETFDDFAAYPRVGNIGEWVSKGNVTLKGFAGKEYGQSGGLGMARVFRAKNRAYLLKAFSIEANHPSVARFIDSLALDAKPSGLPITEPDRPAPIVVQPAPAGSIGPVGPINGPGTGGGMGTGGGIGMGSGIGPGRGGGIGGGERTEGGGGPGPGGPPVDYNRTFRQNEVTRKALIVYKPEPGYTEEARKNNVMGVVRLRVVLNSRGKVTNISVVKGLPNGLTEKSIYAARHIMFFPASKDGRDVSQFVVLEYNYNIY